jgi:hypothetical protein
MQIKWLLFWNNGLCLTSSYQYLSCIHEEKKFINNTSCIGRCGSGMNQGCTNSLMWQWNEPRVYEQFDVAVEWTYGVRTVWCGSGMGLGCTNSLMWQWNEPRVYEQFEDTKGVIRNRKSKDRQYNGRTKRYKRKTTICKTFHIKTKIEQYELHWKVWMSPGVPEYKEYLFQMR